MKEFDEQLRQLEIKKLQLEIKELEQPRVWTSLDIVQVIVSLVLPIALLVITSGASNSLKEIENNQKEIAEQNKAAVENNRRIYDMRFSIYQQISNRLNEIYCYFNYVGKWKELSPVRIVENKRQCDEIMYANQSLFNPKFFTAYNNFMEQAFATYSAQGKDAKLNTDLNTHKAYYKGGVWQSSWNEMFQTVMIDELSVRKQIHNSYNHLLTLLTTELNIQEVQVNNKFNDLKPN